VNPAVATTASTIDMRISFPRCRWVIVGRVKHIVERCQTVYRQIA
jgi:hypothetical protein